jgi:PAS domain-containing protein
VLSHESLPAKFLSMKRLCHVPFFLEDPAQELDYLKESLDFVLEAARMGTWEINLLSGRIYCSIEMLNMWNITPAQINGNQQILHSKVVPEYLPEMKRRIDEAIARQTDYEMTYEIEPEPCARRWVYSKGRCRFRPGESEPVSFFGIVQDITHMQLKN